jgi:hypothetical protein
MLKLLIVALLFFSTPIATQAFTVGDAQKCADTLLSAYNNKTYPRKLLAVESIVITAFGKVFQTFNPDEINLALAIGEKYIEESFTKPSGKYRYQDLVVTAVEATKDGGHRVLGEVTVNSPKGNGRYSFLALVTSAGCKVRQVRVADIMTLVNQLQDSLKNDPRLKKLYKS